MGTLLTRALEASQSPVQELVLKYLRKEIGRGIERYANLELHSWEYLGDCFKNGAINIPRLKGHGSTRTIQTARGCS